HQERYEDLASTLRATIIIRNSTESQPQTIHGGVSPVGETFLAALLDCTNPIDLSPALDALLTLWFLCYASLWSHRFWHDERLPINPAKELASVGVLADCFGRGIKMQRAASAISDVAQMAEPRAFVAFLDVGIRPIARADAVEKVAQV